MSPRRGAVVRLLIRLALGTLIDATCGIGLANGTEEWGVRKTRKGGQGGKENNQGLEWVAKARVWSQSRDVSSAPSGDGPSMGVGRKKAIAGLVTSDEGTLRVTNSLATESVFREFAPSTPDSDTDNASSAPTRSAFPFPSCRHALPGPGHDLRNAHRSSHSAHSTVQSRCQTLHRHSGTWRVARSPTCSARSMHLPAMPDQERPAWAPGNDATQHVRTVNMRAPVHTEYEVDSSMLGTMVEAADLAESIGLRIIASCGGRR